MKPDYAFFPDKQTLDEAYSHKQDGEDFYKKAVAVGDAKAWNVLLDKSRQGKAHREMTNPSFQIDVYLRATPPKWAILTNGKLWRLYHEDTSVKMDCYYEIDLLDLINKIDETGDINPFRYFYLFFRVEAFPQMPLGSSFLDRVREESAAYAQKVGIDLQENVYKAMKALSEGFFIESSNSLSYSAEDVKDVQDNSLSLLYRLLFIFYAESRKLLNTDNKHYREMSLRKLKEEISEKIDQGETILTVRTTYWEGLKDLFRLINEGSEAFGYPKEEFYIPAYNGGLFDPAENPFLSQKRIGNLYLAEAIDLLARSKGESGMVFVDYSSLNIRHLGSIYEGILEYKLRLAEEPMVAIKEKGKEIWLPKQEAGRKKISDSVEVGCLYLVTDKGERKATGSYYTPEYIVKYIVKNALAPLIDPMVEEAIWSEELRKDLLKKLLSIKVLDPAMGSGHFLVEATDYIAREIIHAKEIARREDLDTEDVAEHDVHWARREVVRNCIYGVDLNPMAVELSKLSLWLTTMAANKPLSFLDHHLRCGNSLVGVDLEALVTFPGEEKKKASLSGDVNIKPKDRARINKVSKDEKQVHLLAFFDRMVKQNADSLIKRYKEIAARPDDDLKTIKDKEAAFKNIQTSELNRRLKELANVWLSCYFSSQVSEEDYYDLRDHLSVEMFPDWSKYRSTEWFKQAQDIADKRCFFNWELEFPEAFFEGGAGFDAVVGNPPYANAWSMTSLDDIGRKAIETCCEHRNFLSGHWDLYIPFISKSLKILRFNGRHSFIIPDAMAREKYASQLRVSLVNDTTLSHWTHFEGENVFDEVSRHCVIYVLKNKPPSPDLKVSYDEPPSKNKIGQIIDRIPLSHFIVGPTNQIRCSSFGAKSNDILSKVDSKSMPVGQYCYVMVGATVHSKDGKSFKKADIISNNKIGNSKRFIDGKTLDRYDIKWDSRYIDYRQKEMYGPRYPELFENEKVLVRKRTAAKEKLIASYDDNRFYCDDTIIVVTYYDNLLTTNAQLNFEGYERVVGPKPKLSYILSLINSNILTYVFKLLHATGTLQGSYSDVYPQQVRAFPLRTISMSTPEDERIRFASDLKDSYATGRFVEVLNRVDECLPKNEAGEFVAEGEKSDVVHDLLAHLAEEMIRMNKKKQEEIKKFLGWLENDMGAKVEDLTNKTKIQAYYEIEFPEFLAVLKKNKKKIQVDYSRYDPNSRLLEAFNTSLSRLKPLITKIEETDRLIDLVVYKLYGLTDEEIKMVEDAIAK